MTIPRIFLLVNLLAALGWPSCPHPAQAGDATSLIAALREADAALLREPVWRWGEASLALIQTGEFGHARTGPWRMGVGALTAEITLRTRKEGSEIARMPVLTLSVNGRKVASMEGEETYLDQPFFAAQIAEMDPGNPYPEVVFSSYTGGAHCCSGTRILASSPDGKSWRVVEAGHFDGGPLLVDDADNDGRAEIVERDNQFLYAFGCYACSRAPLKIERLDKGKLIVVSRETSFADRQRQYLKSMIERAEPDMDINAFLAGYVAQKVLIGEGPQAIALMRQHFDRDAGIDYEQCSIALDKEGNCKGKMLKLDFAAALEHFLKTSGYDWEK
ncbi:MAG: hypothetical protein VX871_06885 [Pseudomonadota bacterium]|nr:hypothetical protein [Pseudomonadota bacterium]